MLIVPVNWVQWSLTRKRSKTFLPLDVKLPNFPLKKLDPNWIRKKLRVPLNTKSKVLLMTWQWCHPRLSNTSQSSPKPTQNPNHQTKRSVLTSFFFPVVLSNGKNQPQNVSRSIMTTNSAADIPTKFLGQLIGANSARKDHFSTKVWPRLTQVRLEVTLKYDYWNYLSPSLFFHLDVNNYSLIYCYSNKNASQIHPLLEKMVTSSTLPFFILKS